MTNTAQKIEGTTQHGDHKGLCKCLRQSAQRIYRDAAAELIEKQAAEIAQQERTNARLRAHLADVDAVLNDALAAAVQS